MQLEKYKITNEKSIYPKYCKKIKKRERLNIQPKQKFEYNGVDMPSHPWILSCL